MSANTPHKLPHLGPLERKIMQIFWDYPCSTVRSVQEQLLIDGDKLAYTTVMTIMTRLVEKQLLKREMKGNKYCYKPIQSKQKFVKNLVHKTMNTFVNRFGQDAVLAFLDEAEKLSPSEKDKLIKELKQ